MRSPSLTLVMPTISWDETFCRCARAALAGLESGDEALVVFDGVPPPAPTWLLESGALLLNTGLRQGPAAARNLAARSARGEILLFVDADVELHPDAIKRIRTRFCADPTLAALFGSYDDRPAAPGVVSRFRNLLHHHTHSSQLGAATTFWAGCGAVCREAFQAAGGFDAVAYQRPSIEDIEFGLRLSDAGNRIELDPSIQGTHHKRWTLRSMVTTDIRQRAIPWSRLLLERRELPTTLNLTTAARLSAAASLLLPLALVGVALPGLQALALATFVGCLGLLLLLNRSFYALLLQCGGPLEACAGVGLHGLYLAYSSLTYILMALAQVAGTPLRQPVWLAARPGLRRILVVAGLVLLALLGLAATTKGLILGWRYSDTDLYERLDEWRLFAQGIYPSHRLASLEQRALPHFRTSVYLPWALPLFGALFAWGGATQGTWLIQGLSLLSLALLAGIGWHSLRAWGRAAAWLGALAPLAIAANSNALAQGQFSIVCMGLVGLQGLLLLRDRPLPAGICWALAMVKPQIAAAFALPLLVQGQRRGLALGLILLASLSGVALLHTHTDPRAYLTSWLAVLPRFIGAGNVNATAGLVDLAQVVSSPVLAAPGSLAVFWAGCSLGAFGWWLQRQTRKGLLVQARTSGVVLAPKGNPSGNPWRWKLPNLDLFWRQNPLALTGLCAVVGAVGFYHRNLDNVMLVPALLVSWRLTLQRPRVLEALLTVLMALSVWTPQRLLDALPGSALVQSLIWVALGIRLVAELAFSEATAKISKSKALP
jgi:glycosyltransferase involved in cell wall biosynthesis